MDIYEIRAEETREVILEVEANSFSEAERLYRENRAKVIFVDPTTDYNLRSIINRRTSEEDNYY